MKRRPCAMWRRTHGRRRAHLVEEAARRDKTCNSQTEAKPDRSSWRSGGQSSKIDSRLMSRPKPSRGLHNGVTTQSSARSCWTMTVQAWWSKSLHGGKKLKQGFETHGENLKDLMAQSCRAAMARLSDLEVKAEELQAELASRRTWKTG